MGKKITFWPALLTAIGMVIGSGIFFRASTILEYSNGNITSALLGWITLGITMIFAGLCLSLLAQHTTEEGGTIGYMKEVFGKRAAFITGWFETIIYVPVLTSILSIIAARYSFQIAGYDINAINPLYIHCLAVVYILITFGFNCLSYKFAAYFSSVATVIKLLPIILFGVLGVVNMDTSIIAQDAHTMTTADFTGPLLSMAFAFAGWHVAASMARDMENPQRDLSRVLAINLIIVTVAYIFYFFGISMLMDVDQIRDLGTAHLGVIADNVLGSFGSKLVLLCVVMSILGTLNAKFIAGFKYNHALAENNDLPYAKTFTKDSKFKTSINAGCITLVAAAIWFTFFTIQAVSKFHATPEAIDAGQYAFSGITFDDIPIMLVAVEIIVLLVAASIIARRNNYGIFRTYIFPLIGAVGQFFILVSFANTNDKWVLYTIVSIIIILFGFVIKMWADKVNKAKA